MLFMGVLCAESEPRCPLHRICSTMKRHIIMIMRELHSRPHKNINTESNGAQMLTNVWAIEVHTVRCTDKI